jgi:hypothetical protein
MFARPWLATAQRFVTLATEVANSLDFATVVREPRHPLAWRAETLRWLWWDLYAEGRKAGPSAIAMIEAGASIRDELAIAANSHDDGDLDPWLDRRDRVLELLGDLHAAGPQDEPADGDHDIVVRSAVVPATPSRPTQGRPPAIGSGTQAPTGGKGDKAEKDPRGRPRKAADATREAQAAWWRDHAHLEPEIADQPEDDTLDQLFDRLRNHEFEIRLRQLGAEDLPTWWPRGSDRRPVEAVRFREQWKTTSSTTWAKYVQRFDNDTLRGREDAPRHHQGNVEPKSPPETERRRRMTTAEAAIRAFDDAAEIAADLVVASGKDRGKLCDDIRRALSMTGINGIAADELLDREPADMVAEFQKRRRRVEESQAGTKKRR